MKKRINSSSFWKSGGAEVFGFLCTLPSLIFILVMIISIIQHGTVKELLEYTAYKACRSAIVCESIDEAKIAAEDEALATLFASTEKFDPNSVTVSLSYADGTKEGTKKYEKNWKKGEYIQCTISLDVESPTPFLSGTKTSSITMMIETPANEGSTYPWFKN